MPEPKPAKRMSLMDAAVAILKDSGEPMDTRGIVKPAAEKGYWTPTACKTRFSHIFQNGMHRFLQTRGVS